MKAANIIWYSRLFTPQNIKNNHKDNNLKYVIVNISIMLA